MKKVVLTILSAFVMLLFIFLNYLIWDREKKIDIDKDNQASIAALGREIKSLETVNSSLKDRSTKLENDLKVAEDKINEAQQEKVKLTASLNQAQDNINQLKQMVDVKAFEAVISKWAEAMEKGQYDLAYQTMLPSAIDPQLPQDEFVKQCKSKIKSFKLISVKPLTSEAQEDKKGDIQFKVELDVKRNADSGKFIFDEGTISKKLSLTFLKAKNSWVVSQIQ